MTFPTGDPTSIDCIHQPAHAMSSPNHYQFNVVMSCQGCSNAVNKVLTRLQPDVSKVDISLEKQTVDVYTVLPYEQILEKIKKTGKEVKSGQQL